MMDEDIESIGLLLKERKSNLCVRSHDKVCQRLFLEGGQWGMELHSTAGNDRWWHRHYHSLPLEKKYRNFVLKIHYKISKIVLNLLIWYSRCL